MRSGDTSVFCTLALIPLIRVLIRLSQRQENEDAEIITVAVQRESTEAETENEEMTPKYLPPPCAAEDGNEQKEKENENEIQP